MFRGSSEAIVLVTVAFCASCGGSGPATETVRFVPVVPAEYEWPAESLSFEWEDGPTAEVRANEMLDWLTAEGIDASARAYVDGAQIVEATWEVPESYQVFFVSEHGWSGALGAALMRDHYAIRAEAEVPTRVSLVGPDESLFSLEYLYGDNWWGPLEAELYRAFANPELDPASPEPFIAAAEETLERFGISMRGDRLVALDALLEALPRSDDTETAYQPVATLVAIGLVLGDTLESRHGPLRWVPGAEVMARYFGLRVGEEDWLRPIDFVMEAYRSPMRTPIASYVELVSVRASIE